MEPVTLKPPSLAPPPVAMPTVRVTPVPVPVPAPLPSSASPTVVAIPLPQHLMRQPSHSIPSLPIPVPAPALGGRAPPPLVPDHLHSSTTHLASPGAYRASHPTSTISGVRPGDATLSRPVGAGVTVSPSPSSTLIPSLPVPSLPVAPTPVAPTPARAPAPSSQPSSVPMTPLLRGLPSSSQNVQLSTAQRLGSQPAAPLPVSTGAAAATRPSVTVVSPHSSVCAPPVPLPPPTPASLASQSLSVPLAPPPQLLAQPPTLTSPPPLQPASATQSAAHADVQPPVAVVSKLTPLPPTVKDLPRRNYLACVYPNTQVLAEATSTRRVGFLGLQSVPCVLHCPIVVTLGADGVAPQEVPQPIGPDYVVFGGARYDSLLLTVPKPPFRPHAVAVNSDGVRRAEAQRVRHLTEQLGVARDYLHLSEPNHHGKALAAGTASSTALTHNGTTSTVVEVPADTSGVVPKRSIWNAAFGGSPNDLSAFIEADESKKVIESVGFVVHSRRQWGLRRHNEVYALGLGQKGTPLQFAAVGGKLDNVLLLLASGARDNQRPFLKALLSPETYQTIRTILEPASTGGKKKRPHKDQVADGDALTTGGVLGDAPDSGKNTSSKSITLYAFEMEPPREPAVPRPDISLSSARVEGVPLLL